ncbi:MAG: type VII toxin-antitoxin system MntA family adenylyltransferase antitoxin [Candidatus Ratteibacteria bacterium]
MIREKKIRHNLIPLLRKFKEKIKKDNDIIFVYIFGSYATENTSSLSDIDLAFYIKEGVDYFEKKLEILSIVEDVLKTDEVDIVILNDISPSFFKEIFNKKNILLDKDKNKRIEFELRKLKEFFDTERLREISEKSLIERIKEGKYGTPNPC